MLIEQLRDMLADPANPEIRYGIDEYRAHGLRLLVQACHEITGIDRDVHYVAVRAVIASPPFDWIGTYLVEMPHGGDRALLHDILRPFIASLDEDCVSWQPPGRTEGYARGFVLDEGPIN